MTIPSTPSEVAYAGDGITTVLPIPFVFDTSVDILVRQQTAGVISTITTGFTISGGGGGNGQVTFTVAPPTGTSTWIFDNPAVTQPTDYIDNDSFPAESHERALDRVTRLVKRLTQQMGRKLGFPDGDTQTNGELADIETRKGKYLFFDAITGAMTYALNIVGTTFTQPVFDSFLEDTDPENIGQLLYPRTDAEIAAGITPLFTIYAPSPRIDVRRYLTAWDDGSVQTSGFQNALNLAYAQRGCLVLPNGLDIALGAIELQMAGSHLDQAVWIEGPGFGGNQIAVSGTPTALFTFRNADSGVTAPNEVQLIIEGLSLRSGSSTTEAFVLSGIANFRLRDLYMRGFGVGIRLGSSLLGTIEGCFMLLCGSGLVTESAGGTGVGCNVISLRDTRFISCDDFGALLKSGSNILFDTCDFEQCGTTGVATSSALRITNTIDVEFGGALVRLHNTWFEQNKGTPILVDSGSDLQLCLEGCLCVNNGDADAEITVLGARSVTITDSFIGPASGGIVNLTCSAAKITNSTINVLTETGVNSPCYEGVVTSLATYLKGFTDSYTGTLTGCTTSPTASVFVNLDGNQVQIVMPDIDATSNTTSCSITGMPARYRPSAQRIVIIVSRNNGVDATLRGTVETSGVINLRPTGTFTAAGIKGSLGGTITYRI